MGGFARWLHGVSEREGAQHLNTLVGSPPALGARGGAETTALLESVRCARPAQRKSRPDRDAETECECDLSLRHW